MARKQLVTLAAFITLAAAGSAARADDITIVNDSFMSTKSRAEVRAEVIAARAQGLLEVSEVDLSPTMPAKRDSTLTRDQVSAEVGPAARALIMQWYPA